MLSYLFFSFLIFGTLCGASCYDIAKKKGRNPESCFALGLIFQVIGLIIVVCLKHKNGTKSKPLIKRLLFGILRFIITLTLLAVFIPFINDGKPELISAIGVSSGIIVLSLLKYGLNVIGMMWTLRGKNFLSLGFPENFSDK